MEMAKGDDLPEDRRDGLSNPKVVVAGQVIGSIVMFGVVYLMLFAIWVYVLTARSCTDPKR